MNAMKLPDINMDLVEEARTRVQLGEHEVSHVKDWNYALTLCY